MTLDPIAKPVAAVLAFFYSLVPNYGIAIVLLTICVMIILTPLTIKQTRSMLVMQKLQPELKRLQEQHKNDRQALNEAVMGLYKEHNASPLGGCLPMLLPFPVFLALFRVLEGLSRIGRDPLTKKPFPNPKYLTHSTRMFQDIVKAGGHLNAFGMDLAKSAGNAGTYVDKLPYFFLLLVMVGTQYYQQRQLTSRNPSAAMGQQQAIMKFIPLFFGVISIRFPAGVVVYWTVSNSIRIFQQWAMYRYDPKVKALVTKDIKEVEAKTREIDEAERKAARPRLRDLLSGAATPDAGKGNTKPAPSKPPATKPRTGRPPAAKSPSDAKAPPDSKAGPAGRSPGTAKSPTAGKPAAAGKPATAAGKPARGVDKVPPAKTGNTPGTTNGTGPRAVDKKPAAPIDQPVAADEGEDARPTPKPQSNGGTASGGAPRGRTGGSSARPSSRSRRARRGR